MIRNILDGRLVSARTTFTITIAWLVGVIMAATYMYVRNDDAVATIVASTVATRTTHARQLGTVRKDAGCPALPTTIATTSAVPITFACSVGVAYKTFVHGAVARRTHVGIARTFALHPNIAHAGDSVRYELVSPR